MTSTFIRDLTLHFEAGYPIIFIISQEETRVFELASEAAKIAGRTFIRPRPNGKEMSVAAQISAAKSDNTVIMLDNIHRNLDDPGTIRLLADIASQNNSSSTTVLICAPWLDMPPELERMAAVLELPLPTPTQLRAVLDQICAEVNVLQTEDDALAMIRIGQGLTMDEARLAFRKAMIDSPEEATASQASVTRDKRRALRRSKVLEHVDTPINLNDVGGLDQLKQWLDSRKDAFSDRARNYGLPTPRGLLLMGIQGCGKSLAAKAVAGFWGLPLIRLDLSAVFGQPRPEADLRSALKIAEAMAPAVLWIDEIEKGFDQRGDGPAARLLGGMVTWLQEKQHEVFVVATANRVENLPPELPRKGRFDEIFFVDLPSKHERREILSLHLRNRNLNPDTFDLETLVRQTEKMTGSELEQLIIAAMYAAFNRNDVLKDSDLIRARRETVTLYETFESDIKKLREWARKRARPASLDRRTTDLFSKTSLKDNNKTEPINKQ